MSAITPYVAKLEFMLVRIVNQLDGTPYQNLTETERAIANILCEGDRAVAYLDKSRLAQGIVRKMEGI